MYATNRRKIMPEYKGVWYLCECFGEGKAFSRRIAQALMVRYSMEENYDYSGMVRPDGGEEV
jgi:hypothetical protein